MNELQEEIDVHKCMICQSVIYGLESYISHGKTCTWENYNGAFTFENPPVLRPLGMPSPAVSYRSSPTLTYSSGNDSDFDKINEDLKHYYTSLLSDDDEEVCSTEDDKMETSDRSVEVGTEKNPTLGVDEGNDDKSVRVIEEKERLLKQSLKFHNYAVPYELHFALKEACEDEAIKFDHPNLLEKVGCEEEYAERNKRNLPSSYQVMTENSDANTRSCTVTDTPGKNVKRNLEYVGRECVVSEKDNFSRAVSKIVNGSDFRKEDLSGEQQCSSNTDGQAGDLLWSNPLGDLGYIEIIGDDDSKVPLVKRNSILNIGHEGVDIDHEVATCGKAEVNIGRGRGMKRGRGRTPRGRGRWRGGRGRGYRLGIQERQFVEVGSSENRKNGAEAMTGIETKVRRGRGKSRGRGRYQGRGNLLVKALKNVQNVNEYVFSNAHTSGYKACSEKEVDSVFTPLAVSSKGRIIRKPVSYSPSDQKRKLSEKEKFCETIPTDLGVINKSKATTFNKRRRTSCSELNEVNCKTTKGAVLETERFHSKKAKRRRNFVAEKPVSDTDSNSGMVQELVVLAPKRGRQPKSVNAENKSVKNSSSCSKQSVEADTTPVAVDGALDQIDCIDKFSSSYPPVHSTPCSVNGENQPTQSPTKSVSVENKSARHSSSCSKETLELDIGESQPTLEESTSDTANLISDDSSFAPKERCDRQRVVEDSSDGTCLTMERLLMKSALMESLGLGKKDVAPQKLVNNPSNSCTSCNPICKRTSECQEMVLKFSGVKILQPEDCEQVPLAEDAGVTSGAVLTCPLLEEDRSFALCEFPSSCKDLPTLQKYRECASQVNFRAQESEASDVHHNLSFSSSSNIEVNANNPVVANVSATTEVMHVSTDNQLDMVSSKQSVNDIYEKMNCQRQKNRSGRILRKKNGGRRKRWVLPKTNKKLVASDDKELNFNSKMVLKEKKFTSLEEKSSDIGNDDGSCHHCICPRKEVTSGAVLTCPLLEEDRSFALCEFPSSCKDLPTLQKYRECASQVNFRAQESEASDVHHNLSFSSSSNIEVNANNPVVANVSATTEVMHVSTDNQLDMVSSKQSVNDIYEKMNCQRQKNLSGRILRKKNGGRRKRWVLPKTDKKLVASDDKELNFNSKMVLKEKKFTSLEEKSSDIGNDDGSRCSFSPVRRASNTLESDQNIENILKVGICDVVKTVKKRTSQRRKSECAISLESDLNVENILKKNIADNVKTVKRRNKCRRKSEGTNSLEGDGKVGNIIKDASVDEVKTVKKRNVQRRKSLSTDNNRNMDLNEAEAVESISGDVKSTSVNDDQEENEKIVVSVEKVAVIPFIKENSQSSKSCAFSETISSSNVILNKENCFSSSVTELNVCTMDIYTERNLHTRDLPDTVVNVVGGMSKPISESFAFDEDSTSQFVIEDIRTITSNIWEETSLEGSDCIIIEDSCVTRGICANSKGEESETVSNKSIITCNENESRSIDMETLEESTVTKCTSIAPEVIILSGSESSFIHNAEEENSSLKSTDKTVIEISSQDTKLKPQGHLSVNLGVRCDLKEFQPWQNAKLSTSCRNSRSSLERKSKQPLKDNVSTQTSIDVEHDSIENNKLKFQGIFSVDIVNNLQFLQPLFSKLGNSIDLAPSNTGGVVPSVVILPEKRNEKESSQMIRVDYKKFDRNPMCECMCGRKEEFVPQLDSQRLSVLNECQDPSAIDHTWECYLSPKECICDSSKSIPQANVNSNSRSASECSSSTSLGTAMESCEYNFSGKLIQAIQKNNFIRQPISNVQSSSETVPEIGDLALSKKALKYTSSDRSETDLPESCLMPLIEMTDLSNVDKFANNPEQNTSKNVYSDPPMLCRRSMRCSKSVDRLTYFKEFHVRKKNKPGPKKLTKRRSKLEDGYISEYTPCNIDSETEDATYHLPRSMKTRRKYYRKKTSTKILSTHNDGYVTDYNSSFEDTMDESDFTLKRVTSMSRCELLETENEKGDYMSVGAHRLKKNKFPLYRKMPLRRCKSITTINYCLDNF